MPRRSGRSSSPRSAPARPTPFPATCPARPRWPTGAGPQTPSFVAETETGIAGTYYLRANQQGGGAHVANCGYITAPDATGRGIARTMCEHSMEEARGRGFEAMQFNFVVSTNARAVALWQRLGFDVIGTLPNAFNHPRQGFVDALRDASEALRLTPLPEGGVAAQRWGGRGLVVRDAPLDPFPCLIYPRPGFSQPSPQPSPPRGEGSRFPLSPRGRGGGARRAAVGG